MISRRKSKHTCCSKELSQRSKDDGNRISQLSDHLICQIISLLSTGEAVKTSVLSTRWRHVWLLLPSLELNSRKFSDTNAFVSFGDRFLDSSMVTCIQKLKLTLGENASIVNGTSYFTSWIDAAVKRKIQYLDIDWDEYGYFTHSRLRLHSCETLVFLRLFKVFLDDAVFVVLPCLKTMYLEQNWYPNEATLKKLISSCPVLKSLKIVASNIDGQVYRVHSRSLKNLNIERRTLKVFNGVAGIVIDAPLLCSLSIDDDESKSFIVNDFESNAKLNISLNYGLVGSDIRTNVSSRSSIGDFLTGISRVGDMTISQNTFQLICLYMKLEPLPQFEYMSRLCVPLHATSLIWLKTFLRSCPNLKSLILELIGYNNFTEPPSVEDNQSVPKCFLSCLAFIDIKFSFGELGIDMKFVRYFLEHSAVLKKVTLRSDYHSTKDEIFKKILKIPKASTECELVIL